MSLRSRYWSVNCEVNINDFRKLDVFKHSRLNYIIYSSIVVDKVRSVQVFVYFGIPVRRVTVSRLFDSDSVIGYPFTSRCKKNIPRDNLIYSDYRVGRYFEVNDWSHKYCSNKKCDCRCGIPIASLSSSLEEEEEGESSEEYYEGYDADVSAKYAALGL